MNKIIFWFIKTATDSRKGIEDVIVSMIPQVVTLASGLVTSVLIARGLGPEGMGKYALILSISGLVAGLSDLGIGQTAIRYASRAASQGNTPKQLGVLRWAFRLRISLVLLVTTLAFILAPVVTGKMWHAQGLTSVVRLSLFSGIFGAVAAIPMIYFQSLKRFKMNTIVSVGQTIISLIGILLIALLNKWSLGSVVAVTLIATGLGALTFLALVPRSAFFTFKEFKQFINGNLKGLWYAPDKTDQGSDALDDSGANSFAGFMLISSIVVTLIVRADVWLMGIYLNKTEIGLYSVATRVTMPLVIILGALNTALWPRASALTSPAKVIELLRKTFRVSALVAGAGVVYALFAPMLTPWVFGSSYSSAILLGQLLSLRYCIAILICPIAVVGYSFGMVRAYWWINMLQLLVVVCINLLLLPRLGAIGSAIALIANEVMGLIVISFILWHRVVAIEEGRLNERT